MCSGPDPLHLDLIFTFLQAALRSKRSSLGHIAGLVGLSALYKKFLSTQDECRQVQAPHCTQVPVEACHNER